MLLEVVGQHVRLVEIQLPENEVIAKEWTQGPLVPTDIYT